MLQLGDVDGCRHWRTEELRRFNSTKDPNVAHRVSKDVLMMPAQGGELRSAVALADQALAAGEGWASDQTKGMAEYRSGHLREAVPFLLKCRDTAPEAKFVSATEFFLAMAYERAGDHSEALAALERGRNRLAELPRETDGENHSGGSDWILAHSAYREAEAIVQGNGPSSP